jgi:protease PrsW
MLEDGSQQTMPLRKPRTNAWLKVLLIGFLFYGLSIAVLFFSGNPNLFPTTLIIGSFMVPAAYVSFFYERRELSRLSLPTTALAFVYGGVLGVMGASLLEPLLVPGQTTVGFFVVGLIEEFVKIIGVLVLAVHRRHDSELDGIILGAAAGMGFAALESNGYGFTAFMSSQGNLPQVFSIVFVRALLAPVGHGTWTAILASVLFRESDKLRFHINLKVVGAYVTVVILHGLWDALPGIMQQSVSFPIAQVVGQFAVGAAGLFILWLRWREAKRRQMTQLEFVPPTA